jgi:hypothetical protein
MCYYRLLKTYAEANLPAQKKETQDNPRFFGAFTH